jgi:hypothetical protein
LLGYVFQLRVFYSTKSHIFYVIPRKARFVVNDCCAVVVPFRFNKRPEPSFDVRCLRSLVWLRSSWSWDRRCWPWAEFSGRILRRHGVCLCYVESYVFRSYTEFVSFLLLFPFLSFPRLPRSVVLDPVGLTWVSRPYLPHTVSVGTSLMWKLQQLMSIIVLFFFASIFIFVYECIAVFGLHFSIHQRSVARVYFPSFFRNGLLTYPCVHVEQRFINRGFQSFTFSKHAREWDWSMIRGKSVCLTQN